MQRICKRKCYLRSRLYFPGEKCSFEKDEAIPRHFMTDAEEKKFMEEELEKRREIAKNKAVLEPSEVLAFRAWKADQDKLDAMRTAKGPLKTAPPPIALSEMHKAKHGGKKEGTTDILS